jgi:hypothetical protein
MQMCCFQIIWRQYFQFLLQNGYSVELGLNALNFFNKFFIFTKYLKNFCKTTISTNICEFFSQHPSTDTVSKMSIARALVVKLRIFTYHKLPGNGKKFCIQIVQLANED